MHTMYIISFTFTSVFVNSFPDFCEEMKPPPPKKVYNEKRSFHAAYDNAENR